MKHKPVLLTEVLDLLSPQKNQNFCDMTLGLGGHAQAILEHTEPDGKIFGFEQDARNGHLAAENLARFGERVRIFEYNFAATPNVLHEEHIPPVDGFLFDLGISSLHLDDPERGFSFRQDGPLDMRLDAEHNPVTAAQILADSSVQELTDIFRTYGEEPRAYSLAQKIKARQTAMPFLRTRDLAQFVEEQTPKGRQSGGGHPAALIFQALRIAVNDELGVLEKTLPQILPLLKVGGRIAVISFHSLEDRIVKNFFRDHSTQEKHQKYPHTSGEILRNSAPLRVITKKAILPTRQEVEENPRARSARLRVAEKIFEI